MILKTIRLRREQTASRYLTSYLNSWCLLLCLMATLPSFCQEKSILFDRLTVENGLRNPSVLQLMQDEKGFIWMVTPTGVVKYDGYQSKHYRPYLDPEHPYRPRIFAVLFQDSQGTIWLGLTMIHRVNLFRYDPVMDDFVPFLYDPTEEDNPIQDGIGAIGEDRFGNLLVGTSGIGLYIVDPNAGKVIAHHQPEVDQDQGFPSSDVFTPILMDREGNNWMPTYDGISKYDAIDGTFQNFKIPSPAGKPPVACREILFGDQKTLWVGTGGSGLWKFDLEEERFIQSYIHNPSNPHSIAFDQVFNIEQGINGQLWISGSRNSENRSVLSLFDPISGQFTVIKDRANADSRLPFTVIRDILADRSGNIWLATWQTGIFRHNSNKDVFEVQKWPEAVQQRTGKAFINGFTEDQNQNIWVGTEKGLWKWDREKGDMQQFKVAPQLGIREDAIGGTMVIIGDDQLLLSSRKEVHVFDFGTKQFTKWTDVLEVQPEFFVQSDGTLWAFNVNGICRVQAGRDSKFMCIPDLLGRGIVSAFAEESPEDLWIGMNHFGLLHFNPKTDSLEEYIGHYGVHDIEFDQAGQCWVITHSSGLRIFDRETNNLIELPPEENERIGQAEEMVKLPNGQFWITSSRGIIHFDPQTRKVLRRFSPNNWQLPEQTWHRSAHQSPLLSSSGELLFSSPGGILHFHPDSIRIDSTPPQIALTDFYLFDKRLKPGADSLLPIEISYANRIDLSYHQDNFTIQFAALHYKVPSENQYRYRLDNNDPPGQWRAAGHQREASYNNLSPGHYTFRVQASNSDGIWTTEESQEARLEIRIWPAWYNTTFAYITYLVLFVLSMVFGYRLLLKRRLQRAETDRLRDLEVVKSNLYTNITHEFRTPLTLILGQVQQIRENWEIVPPHLLDSISRNGKQLLRLVNQLLGIATIETGKLILKPVRSEVIRFFRQNVEAFSAIAKNKELDLTFTSRSEAFFMDFDPTYLKQIIDNLLSNAIKFTSAGGHITNELIRDEDQLIFQVQDSGIGIAQEDLPHIFDRFYRSKKQPENNRIKAGEGAGIGLAFTKELVELMHGEIQVQSSLGHGTCFRVVLPITHKATLHDLPLEISQAAEMPANGNPQSLYPENTVASPATTPILLIVEDHAEVRSYLRACLESNYQVLEATDGQAGHQLAQEVIPDLVISDVMMPLMDGFELCHSLKSNQSTSHIPIILLTAKADTQSRLTGLQKGADVYLAKPFLKQELLLRVEKLLELRERLRYFYQSLSSESLIEAIPAPEPEEAQFVKQVKNLVLQQLEQGEFGVQKLANDLYLSRSQLNRKMQALVGIPAIELIRDLRLAKAIELLRQEELTITEISYKTGFTDPRYFSRVFKQIHGMTPSQFRQAL